MLENGAQALGAADEVRHPSPELAAEKGTAFRRRFVGRTLQAVTLADPGEGGAVRALTGNFFEVLLPAASAVANRLVEVTVLEADDGGAVGIPAGDGIAGRRAASRGDAPPVF